MPTTSKTIGRQARLFDARPDRIDLRDRPYLPRLVSLPPQWPDAKLIKKYFPLYNPLVLDQGKQGACTGFGLAAVVNYLVWRKALKDNPRKAPKITPVSPRMLYELARVYDEWPGEDYEGSSCRGAIKGWHKHGVCSFDTWPYKQRFSSPSKGWAAEAAACPLGAYYRVDRHSIADLQSALFETGAVYAAAQVHDGWDQKATSAGLPIMPLKPAHNDAGHAFALVGYTQDGFIVQNSWGQDWGYHGFAVLSYEDWARNGSDAWVAALGAPMRVAAADTGARRRESLADYHKVTQLRAGAGGVEAVSASVAATPEPTQPWAGDEAREHTVVLGNNGRPQRNHFIVADGAAGLKRVAYTLPKAWLAAQKGVRRIALYAHGGLNSEEASIQRIRVLAPYFQANGIYPLFITWKTGVRESIADMLGDAFSREPQTSGLASGIFGDARDRAIEALARQVLVKAVWTEIKENATAAASEGGGVALLAEQLRALRADFPQLEIHLAGHSAGSFPLGYLLKGFIAPRLPVNSVTLFAPACSCAFAHEHYRTAIEAKVLAANTLHVDLMSDAREQDDTVGPYGKSLLYLVCRALERLHKTPILGLENAWKRQPPQDSWAPEEADSAIRWAAYAAQAGIVLQVHNQPKVADGPGHEISIAHGSFDNDLQVVSATLSRMLGGAPLAHPVKDLRGF